MTQGVWGTTKAQAYSEVKEERRKRGHPTSLRISCVPDYKLHHQVKCFMSFFSLNKTKEERPKRGHIEQISFSWGRRGERMTERRGTRLCLTFPSTSPTFAQLGKGERPERQKVSSVSLTFSLKLFSFTNGEIENGCRGSVTAGYLMTWLSSFISPPHPKFNNGLLITLVAEQKIITGSVYGWTQNTSPPCQPPSQIHRFPWPFEVCAIFKKMVDLHSTCTVTIHISVPWLLVALHW